MPPSRASSSARAVYLLEIDSTNLFFTYLELGNSARPQHATSSCKAYGRQAVTRLDTPDVRVRMAATQASRLATYGRRRPPPVRAEHIVIVLR